jgi:hypothetical protein
MTARQLVFQVAIKLPYIQTQKDFHPRFNTSTGGGQRVAL